MIHTLEFLNNVHREGQNVTVRNGDKWYKQVRPGDIVNIAETGKPPTAQARIWGVLSCRFWDIPGVDLLLEHDPACRTSDGLYACMRQVYPGFVGSNYVTVLHYEILDAKNRSYA